MRLLLDNQNVYLEDVPKRTTRLISKRFSYRVAGARFATSFQSGNWDGRKHLVSKLTDGRLRAPSGLAHEIAETLTANGHDFDFLDARRYSDERFNFRFDESILRPYQREATDLVTVPRGPLDIRGRGIIKLPPRSGKTLIGAAVIARFGVRTLFVVPAQLLLRQSVDAISSALGTEVGIIGDGVWKPGPITVTTIQSLLAKRNGGTKANPPEPEYTELMQSCELVIIDEHHHMEGDQWRRVILDSEAPYKVGLSATVFLDHEKECELGVIWLHAIAGDILLDISVSDLIEQGYLIKPDIWMCPIRQPEIPKSRGWSQRLQNTAIYENEYRNARIVGFIKEFVESGRRPVVISNRHNQVFALRDALESAGLSVGQIIGPTKGPDRRSIVESFRARQIDVLLGTVFGEGVDIPEIDAVVVAEGGAGIKQTYQRLRCMTPHDTKKDAIVVDFMDLTHPYFSGHSLERLQVYQSERAFSVKVVE